MCGHENEVPQSELFWNKFVEFVSDYLSIAEKMILKNIKMFPRISSYITCFTTWVFGFFGNTTFLTEFLQFSKNNDKFQLRRKKEISSGSNQYINKSFFFKNLTLLSKKVKNNGYSFTRLLKKAIIERLTQYFWNCQAYCKKKPVLDNPPTVLYFNLYASWAVTGIGTKTPQLARAFSSWKIFRLEKLQKLFCFASK